MPNIFQLTSLYINSGQNVISWSEGKFLLLVNALLYSQNYEFLCGMQLWYAAYFKAPTGKEVKAMWQAK